MFGLMKNIFSFCMYDLIDEKIDMKLVCNIVDWIFFLLKFDLLVD